MDLPNSLVVISATNFVVSVVTTRFDAPVAFEAMVVFRVEICHKLEWTYILSYRGEIE